MDLDIFSPLMFHQPCTSRVGISSSEKPMACSMAWAQYTPWAGTRISLPMTSQSAGQSLRIPAAAVRAPPGKPAKGNVVDQGVKPDVGDEFGVEREFDSPGKAALGAGNAEVRVKVNGVEHFRLAEGRKDKITALFHELLHPFHMVGQAEIPVFFLQFHHFPPFRPKLPSASRSLSVQNCSWRTE